MLAGLYASDAQVAHFSLVFVAEDLGKLCDRLRSNLVVNVADALKGWLSAQSGQNDSKGAVLQAVVIQIDFFNRDVADCFLVYLSGLDMDTLAVFRFALQHHSSEHLGHSLSHAIAYVLAHNRQNLVLGVAKNGHCECARLLAPIIELSKRLHVVACVLWKHVRVHHLFGSLEELVLLMRDSEEVFEKVFFILGLLV